MIGAVAGDIIGSIYERNPIKTEDFPLFHTASCFTDDSVMSLAVAQAILGDRNYGREMKILGQAFPNAGYGGNFQKWISKAGKGGKTFPRQKTKCSTIRI